MIPYWGCRTVGAGLLSLLNAKGFVWQGDDELWIPGIPSLMDYLVDRTEPEPESDRESPEPAPFNPP